MSIANGFISHPPVRFQRLNKILSSSTPSEVAVPSDSFAPDGPSVNIKFDNIVNMRDLCTASATVKVVPSKIFRTGCVSKASEADVSLAIAIRAEVRLEILMKIVLSVLGSRLTHPNQPYI